MFLKNKVSLRLLATAGVALGLSLGAGDRGYSQTPQKLDKVTLALPFPVVSYLVPALGKKMGLFEKHGIDLDIKYIRPGPLEAAIFSGSVDFSLVPAPVNHDMTLAGSGVVTVMTYVKRFEAKLMGAKDVTSVKDLRGKVVSTINASTGQSRFLMLEALESAGLNPDKDVQLRPIASQPDTMNALLTGQVSAAILGPPFWAIAQAQGATTLVDFQAMKDRYWGTANVIALKTYLEKNPDVTVRFLKGMLEAVDAWKNNPDEVKAVLKDEAKMENPRLLDLMAKVSADTLSFGKDTVPGVPENQAALDVLAKVAKTDATARKVDGKKPTDFYDATYIEKALAK